MLGSKVPRSIKNVVFMFLAMLPCVHVVGEFFKREVVKKHNQVMGNKNSVQAEYNFSLVFAFQLVRLKQFSYFHIFIVCMGVSFRFLVICICM